MTAEKIHTRSSPTRKLSSVALMNAASRAQQVLAFKADGARRSQARFAAKNGIPDFGVTTMHGKMRVLAQVVFERETVRMQNQGRRWSY